MTLEFHSSRDVQILCRLSLSLSSSVPSVRMEYLASLLLPAALACVRVRRAGEVAVMRVLPSTLCNTPLPSLQAPPSKLRRHCVALRLLEGGRELGKQIAVCSKRCNFVLGVLQ